MTATSPVSLRRPGAFPSISPSTLMVLLVSGSTATVAFDIWGQAISPMLGYGNLSPDGLARSLLGRLGLPDGAAAGNFIHLLVIGLLAYPIGWLAVFRPLQERFAPGLGWLAASAIYGFGLWILAIGFVAGFALGQPFLKFTTIAWVALVGHVLYGIVCGATVVWLERRR
ncbi:hypothetical protein [Oceaniglobus roseus]|uniref:hypothetical protein n=1 Tax=Oceaniglobus roseus TaxID=1737570 RepID=UPI000C7F1DAA|nr:hypothetical protein [Kandeliimicrobium roseum]